MFGSLVVGSNESIGPLTVETLEHATHWYWIQCALAGRSFLLVLVAVLFVLSFALFFCCSKGVSRRSSLRQSRPFGGSALLVPEEQIDTRYTYLEGSYVAAVAQAERAQMAAPPAGASVPPAGAIAQPVMLVMQPAAAVGRQVPTAQAVASPDGADS